jgi:hypothetical protein
MSGNPKGRPPKCREVRELARKHDRAAFATLLRVARRDAEEPAPAVSSAKTILAYAHGNPEAFRIEDVSDEQLRAEVVRRARLERGAVGGDR